MTARSARMLCLCGLGLLLVLAAACPTRRGDAAKRGKQGQAARPTPGKRPPPSPLDLPTLQQPAPLPAERVVDIFYTSNVAGEAEPCG
jgi:hypothetical protein